MFNTEIVDDTPSAPAHRPSQKTPFRIHLGDLFNEGRYIVDVGPPGVSVAYVEMTPDRARLWLSTNPEKQRSVKRPALSKLTRSLQADKFVFTGDTIKVDQHGKLFDGQHRLRACVESGVPFATLVVFGVSGNVLAMTGDVTRWSASDYLRSQGTKGSTNSLAAAVNMLARYDGHTLKGALTDTSARLTNWEIGEFVKAHPNLKRSLSAAERAYDKSRLTPSIGTLLHYRFSEVDPEAANLFFDKLATGENISGPILLLRDRLVSQERHHSARERWVVVAWVIKAWNAWRAGKDIKNLRFNVDKEKFPSILKGQKVSANGSGRYYF